MGGRYHGFWLLVLISWLVDERCKTNFVTALFAQTNKPDTYPKVDDDATIIVHPKALGIFHASRCWSHDRKDMEIYGTKGQMIVNKKPLK